MKMKKIMLPIGVLAFSFCLLSCKKKVAPHTFTNNVHPEKRIIYIWDTGENAGCFLINGIKKCCNAVFKKLTKNIYTLRLSDDPFSDKNILKFSFSSPKAGLKKAPDTDAVFIDNKNNIYTIYDISKRHILCIASFKNNILKGRFDIRLRNQKGKWIYFTQGNFTAELK
jgi:hypothetical protein